MFFSPKLGEDQKKRSSPTVEVFLLLNHFSRGIWCYIRPQFVGSAQISMVGHLNLDGGTLNLDGGTLTLDGGTRTPYNLSNGCRPTGNSAQMRKLACCDRAKSFMKMVSTGMRETRNPQWRAVSGVWPSRRRHERGLGAPRPLRTRKLCIFLLKYLKRGLKAKSTEVFNLNIRPIP